MFIQLYNRKGDNDCKWTGSKKKKSDNVKIKNNDFQEKNLQSQILK